MTDAGLMELSRLKQLRELHLGDATVSDSGEAALRKALPAVSIGR